MAKLITGYPPGHWGNADRNDPLRCVEIEADGSTAHDQERRQCASWQEHNTKQEESFNRLDPDRVWKAPAADNYARYYVASFKPIRLIHIPTGDGYQALPATIRGLTAKEMKADIERDKTISRMFEDHRRRLKEEKSTGTNEGG